MFPSEALHPCDDCLFYQTPFIACCLVLQLELPLASCSFVDFCLEGRFVGLDAPDAELVLAERQIAVPLPKQLCIGHERLVGHPVLELENASGKY